MSRRFAWFACVAAVALVIPATASANEVTKWNEIAVNTVNAQPPLTSAPNAASIFVAMVQGAVYGAVNAVDRHGRPYLVMRSFPAASADAAAATAAFRVLDTLFPAQHGTLQDAYNNSLAGVPAGKGKDEGIEVGTMAADAMLAEGHDGRTVIGCTFGSGLPGVWQPLAGPMGPLCDPAAWVANAKPFLLTSPSQFRTAGPMPLNSPEYTAELNEVKTVGSIDSLVRTPDQTHAAAFWQTNPTTNYNAIGRRFVDQLSLDVSDSARLFALMDLSAADALINAWNDNYYWNFWRPITAIRATDPTWTPLFDPSLPAAIGGVGPALITPPYPDHVSGANSYASSSMNALRLFFGTDEMSFYATSSRFPAEQRPFSRFSDVITEVIGARIWAGIHFRSADTQAAELGANVARYAYTHYFASAH
jgi:hypothetical protein